jgi:hypothetical protein
LANTSAGRQPVLPGVLAVLPRLKGSDHRIERDWITRHSLDRSGLSSLSSLTAE